MAHIERLSYSTVHIYCHPTVISHSHAKHLSRYGGSSGQFPVDISPCPVLSAIV